MRKPSSRIKQEIAKLQEQLKAAETREAERIGRLALRAGLGDIEIEEGDLVAALEEIAGKFRKGGGRSNKPASTPVAPGATAGQAGEA